MNRNKQNHRVPDFFCLSHQQRQEQKAERQDQQRQKPICAVSRLSGLSSMVQYKPGGDVFHFLAYFPMSWISQEATFFISWLIFFCPT